MSLPEPAVHFNSKFKFKNKMLNISREQYDKAKNKDRMRSFKYMSTS